MDAFWKDLQSLYWWLSVVVVGLIVNLFSQYGVPYISKLLSYYSESIRKKNKIAQEKREEQIQALVNDPDELHNIMLQVLFRNGVITRQILIAFTMSILFALTPKPVNYFFGLVFIVGVSLAFSAMVNNSNIRSNYLEARKRIKSKGKNDE